LASKFNGWHHFTGLRDLPGWDSMRRGDPGEVRAIQWGTRVTTLEEKPLDYFGSYKNKRVRIGYYKYRLETLMQDPDKYFNEPMSFEGNVKPTEDSDASN